MSESVLFGEFAERWTTEVAPLRLRHTYASQSIPQGVNIQAPQEVLGHADASLTLNRYAHLIPSDGRMAADRMGDFLVREQPVTLYGHSTFEELKSAQAA